MSITSHVYHQYTVRVLKGKRDALQTHLKGKGVPTMIYYPVPLHMMKVFEGRSKIFENLKESARAVMEVLSLPIEPLMGILAWSTFLTGHRGAPMVKYPHNTMRKRIYDGRNKPDTGYNSRKSTHIKRTIIPSGM